MAGTGQQTANAREGVRTLAPQPGPQSFFVGCPVPDVCYGGARGGAKTWGLLFDWLAHRYLAGRSARGLLLRRELEELTEVKEAAAKMFPQTGGTFLQTRSLWVWPDKTWLRLRYLDRDADADRYQGHAYTWIGVDEMGNFSSPRPIDLIKACLRSGDAPGVPKWFRGTTNPGGVGHNWIKHRYIDPSPAFKPFSDPATGELRVFIPSKLEDNPALMLNDPDYERQIRAATVGDDALWKAWRYGDWNITAGGMLDDLWNQYDPTRPRHIVAPFEIPPSWFCNRSFDWGSSAPFAVLWWAESDGTQAPDGKHYPRGTLFLIDEWYGWSGRPNEGCQMLASDIARGIVDREKQLKIAHPGIRIEPGPADAAIYDVENGNCLALDMQRAGVRWLPADKSPGTRRMGWQRIREHLAASLQQPQERPGLFIFEHCVQWIRTVPTLPRDKRNREDVDTKAEDHIGDATRYRINGARRGNAY